MMLSVEAISELESQQYSIAGQKRAISWSSANSESRPTKAQKTRVKGKKGKKKKAKTEQAKKKSETVQPSFKDYVAILDQEMEYYEAQFQRLHDAYTADDSTIKKLDFDRVGRLITRNKQRIATKLVIAHQHQEVFANLFHGKLSDHARMHQCEQTMDWALVDLIVARYPDVPEATTTVKQRPRTEDEQEQFRARAVKHYNAVNSEGDFITKKWIWCCVSHQYLEPDYIRAAHVVPRNISEVLASYTFGKPSPESRHGHLMSATNCLLLHGVYEKWLDEARIAIVLDNLADWDQKTFKVIVLNHDRDALYKDYSRLRVHNAPALEELDGRILEFKNDMRPKARYLYFTFVLNVLRHQRNESQSWHYTVRDYIHQPVWASPGEWIRVSALKRIAATLGHYLQDPPPMSNLPRPASESEDNDELNKMVAASTMTPMRVKDPRVSWDILPEVGEESETEVSEGEIGEQ